jgi:septin family protein
MLHKRVTVIPIISKADSMTVSELKEFKDKVITDLKKAGVVPFPFSSSNGPAPHPPFAVIGGTDNISRPIRRKQDGSAKSISTTTGRIYPWGTAEVENEKHCDLSTLRRSIIKENYNSLLAATDSLCATYLNESILRKYYHRFTNFCRAHQQVVITSVCYRFFTPANFVVNCTLCSALDGVGD